MILKLISMRCFNLRSWIRLGVVFSLFFFFFKQKTAYEIKECDWSSDVCSSDLIVLLLYEFMVG